MDDGQLGRLLRAVRHRSNLRQVDLAERCGVPPADISDIEFGRLEEVGLAKARRVADALDVRFTVVAQWHGGEGDRLIDRAHASIAEHVIGFLREASWEVIPEFTFNVYGDRGSVDILAWQPKERILLIIEVKSTLTDLQAMLASLSKKIRVVPGAAREMHGWRPSAVAVILVAPGTTGNRSVVAQHAATFDAALPARSRDVRSWLRRPRGSMAGIWFVSRDAAPGAAMSGSRTRVRRGG